MKYIIEFEPNDLAKIGEALDREPHGEVSGIVARIQAQITVQDKAAKEQFEAEQRRATEDWRNGERAKIKAELTQTKKRKGA